MAEEVKKQSSVGGIWVKTTVKGDKYLSISIELDGKKHNFSAFKNDYKTEKKHPDYRILAPKENVAPKPEAVKTAPANEPKGQPEEKKIVTEDIPF